MLITLLWGVQLTISTHDMHVCGVNRPTAACFFLPRSFNTAVRSRSTWRERRSIPHCICELTH